MRMLHCFDFLSHVQLLQLSCSSRQAAHIDHPSGIQPCRQKNDSQHCHCHLVLSVHSLSYKFCFVLLLLVQLLTSKLSRAWLVRTHHLQQLDPIKSTDTRSQKFWWITYKIFNSSVNITSKSQPTLQSKQNQYLCFVLPHMYTKHIHCIITSKFSIIVHTSLLPSVSPRLSFTSFTKWMVLVLPKKEGEVVSIKDKKHLARIWNATVFCIVS